MKKYLSLLLVIAMMFSLVACGGESANGGNEGTNSGNEGEELPNRVTHVMSAVGNNLDPVVANYTDTSTMVNHIYDTLLDLDNNFNVIAAMATEWNVSDDNMVIEFTIGEGYKFHNGEDVTLEDIKYSIYDRLENIPQAATTYNEIEKVEIVEPNKVIVTAAENSSQFIRTFVNLPIMDKSYCEEVGDAYANAPIGTGPYILDSYVPGNNVVLKAWADYPFEKAKIEYIEFKAIAESASRYIAVESGDSQFTAVGSSDLERARTNENLTTENVPTTFVGFIAMNTTVAPFDNVNVRRAMAYAYNRDEIVKLNEDQTASKSMIPAIFDTYYESDNMPDYDLEEAKRLLAEEGYDESNPLKFELAGYSANPAMEVYQADLRAIGVEMAITQLEFGVFLDNMANKNYQMLTGGWGNVDGNILSGLAVYWSGSFGASNISFYENSEIDELYEKVKSSTSQEEIIEYSTQIQDMGAQDVPMIPTNSRTSTYAYVKNLKGVEIATTGYISYRNAYYE